jgi:hypothetical protein
MRRLVLTAAMLLAVAGYMPAKAEWRLAETKHFRIYSDGPEKSLREQARLLERFDWLMRTMTGAPADRTMPPLDIYLVGSASTLAAIADLPKNTAGFYLAGPSGTAAFAERINDRNRTGLKVLLHEYAHHFMKFHFPYPYPSWYVEGFAEYFSTADVRSDTMTLGEADANSASWLTYGTWIDAEQLMTREAWHIKGDARAMFYAQSWLAVHYLLRDPVRQRQLTTYLTGIRDGGHLKTLFPAAFGIDFTAFGKRLRAYARGRNVTYTRIEIPPGTIAEPPIDVTTLPPSSERTLLPQAALMTGAAGDKQDALVETIRRETAKFADDGHARRVSAAIEAEFGDAAVGRERLSALLAISPADAELHYLVGRSHMRSAIDEPAARGAHHTAARRHFARAFRTRPGHYQTLFNYVLAGDDPRAPRERDVLAAARDLAPQVADISVMLAQVLVFTGEFERAERILLGLTMNPHQPPSQYMRALLDMARARQADEAVLKLLEGS